MIIRREDIISYDYKIGVANFQNNYKIPIRVMKSTGNCQLSTICYAENLLRDSDEKNIEFFKEFVKYTTPLLLVDIKIDIEKKLIKLFTENGYKVLTSTSYTSSNNSSMIIIIFKKE